MISDIHLLCFLRGTLVTWTSDRRGISEWRTPGPYGRPYNTKTGKYNLRQLKQEQETHTAALNCLQAVTWDRVRLVTASDPDMNQLVSIIESGMPSHRHELPTPLRDYHQFRNDLYTVGGVVIYKERVVIPPSLREEVLAALHAAHQRVSSKMARAEASVFWPGITSDITTLRARCSPCNCMSPSQPSAPPGVPQISPIYPFQCVRRLLSVFWCSLPGSSRQLLQLAHRWEGGRWCQGFKLVALLRRIFVDLWH